MQPKDPIALIKRLTLPIGIVIAAGVIFGLVQLLSMRNFRMTGTDPALSSVSYASPFLKVNFNRPLSDGMSVKANQDIIDKYQVKDKTIVISLNRLSGKTSYRITVSNVKAKDGTNLPDQQLEFKTLGEVKLSPEQQKAKTIQQDQKTAASTDPILDHLPYSNLDFSLNPNISAGADGKDVLSIEAQILLAPGTSAADEPGEVARVKNEITAYIKQFNLDPAKYTIEYTVVHEELTGH